MAERSWKLMPGTAPGKWAVGLIVGMPILFVLGSTLAQSLYAAIPSGSNLVEDIAARPFLALAMLAGMIAGISGFLTGLLAILKHKDHAILVYGAAVIGGLVTILLIGQLAFPE